LSLALDNAGELSGAACARIIGDISGIARPVCPLRFVTVRDFDFNARGLPA